MQYTDAASSSLAANYVYSINNFFIFRCAYAMFYLNNRGLEYLAHARTDCARHARAEVRGCVVLLIDGLSRFTYSRSPTRSLRVGNGLATLLDNMREIHAPALQPLVSPSYAEQAHLGARERASRGKPVLICILARSLGFHAITPECSSFRENPTLMSTIDRR